MSSADFLQGQKLKRDLFMEPPAERQEKGKLWRLVKSTYGLMDASRQFYLAVKKELEALEMKRCREDEAVFYLHKNNTLQGLLTLHVDDIGAAGNQYFQSNILDKLTEKFTFGKVSRRNFKYTGLQIHQKEDFSIMVNQNDYISEMDEIVSIPDGKQEEALEKKQLKTYRRAVGQIAWAQSSTRPDLSFKHLEMSTKMHSATISDLKSAKKTIKFAKSKDVEVTFKHLGPWENLHLEVYSDAGFRQMEEKNKSVGANVVFSVMKSLKQMFYTGRLEP